MKKIDAIKSRLEELRKPKKKVSIAELEKILQQPAEEARQEMRAQDGTDLDWCLYMLGRARKIVRGFTREGPAHDDMRPADIERAQCEEKIAHAFLKDMEADEEETKDYRNMAVDVIVGEWLQKNGFTGLITDGCGCVVGDLFCCSADGVEQCRPGYAGDSGYVYETLELAKEDAGPPDGQESCL